MHLVARLECQSSGVGRCKKRENGGIVKGRDALRGGFLALGPMLLLRLAAACWNLGRGASNGEPIVHMLFVAPTLSASFPILGPAHQNQGIRSVPGT